MVQSSEHTQEYKIKFKESYTDRLSPSCNEGDDWGLQAYDAMTIQQGI